MTKAASKPKTKIASSYFSPTEGKGSKNNKINKIVVLPHGMWNEILLVWTCEEVGPGTPRINTNVVSSMGF